MLGRMDRPISGTRNHFRNLRIGIHCNANAPAASQMRIDGTWIFDLAKSGDDFTWTPPRIRKSQRDKSESHDRRRLERNTFRC